MKPASAVPVGAAEAATSRSDRVTFSPARAASAYDVVGLVLQGGGALGAYQCGVYEALHAAGVEPMWFAGVSIGAINAAILAGNAPDQRLDKLREFWELICQPVGAFASTWIGDFLDRLPPSDALAGWRASGSAFAALLQGQRGFFSPRLVSPLLLGDGSPSATSFYDVTPLRSSLERFVDFDRINGGDVRLTVGATHVRSGNFEYFDSAKIKIRPEHILASGALPPAFASVEIDGEHYWDGGLVSNTPLEYLLESTPRHDTLAFQVDLWSARGELPKTMLDVLERQKDILYSSRTRKGTDTIAERQRLRNALETLLKALPEGTLTPEVDEVLRPYTCTKVFNIVQVIYRAKVYEEQFKDYAFGRAAMRVHWQTGRDDMGASLARPEFLARPDPSVGVVTHDIHREDDDDTQSTTDVD